MPGGVSCRRREICRGKRAVAGRSGLGTLVASSLAGGHPDGSSNSSSTTDRDNHRIPELRWRIGAGVALITLAIRRWGGYPDGIAFAVLVMNMAVPLIDRYTKPRVFGQ